jgi:DNA-binding NarL/FixJ family response regulator
VKKGTNEPAFKDLEARWNEKLRKSGFVDIEDSDRQLTDYHSTHFRKPSVQARMTQRERYNERLQNFINHPQFKAICKSLSRHGNSSLTPRLVHKILELHGEGLPEREIAKKVRRGKKAVHLTLSKAFKWMEVA